jgi:general secretion pathway protein E
MGTTVFDRQLDAPRGILVGQGSCGHGTPDRARQVAIESDQCLDAALIRLGLVSERRLVEPYASLLSARIVSPDRYPSAADPLDPFELAATGLPVRVEVAVPLETALNRLDPEVDQAAPEADRTPEEDAERLKEFASEAPVIGLLNLPITRAADIGERRMPREGRIKMAVRGHDVYSGVTTVTKSHDARCTAPHVEFRPMTLAAGAVRGNMTWSS